MSAKVGADIESICGKCGDVWHVVVAKVGDRIARVQCKQCLTTHRHRPPEKAASEASPPTRRAKPDGAAPRKSAKTRLEEGPRVPIDPSKPPRPYRPADTYQVGDRLSHATFGSGVVEAFPGPGKMEVYFPSGRRVLALLKVASTLPPPARRDD